MFFSSIKVKNEIKPILMIKLLNMSFTSFTKDFLWTKKFQNQILYKVCCNSFVLYSVKWRVRFFFLRFDSPNAIWQTTLSVVIRLPWAWISFITLKIKSGWHWWTKTLILIPEICQVTWRVLVHDIPYHKKCVWYSLR